MPEELRFFLKLFSCRVYTALDDLGHYQTTRLALPMRRIKAWENGWLFVVFSIAQWTFILPMNNL